jgi:succinate dehydrogenase / fumarate reductase, membrane anchor subunit
MTKNNNQMRSPLSKARNLGSAKSGNHHWLMQRISAVFLIPLAIWFAITIINIVKMPFIDSLRIITNPFNGVMIILFIGMMLYHGMLGMKIIIEDYVHCETMKNIIIIAIYAFTIFTAVAAIFAIFTFYISVMSS